ncbi:hypothetical protein [Devosia faecipullorum]|uniref:hypothetical protein n=1 Tax=Devosia faecipullorum TaxID=2755039 RepID=UPI00187B2F26|nr:hypothetical protein [Devosia faecipullorum]MBE7731928.1 hypothetical protein [Devosia faecipullorum]
MHLLRLAAFTIALAAVPASAQGEVSLRLMNESNRVVTSLSVYPIDADGDPVEDNLGGSYDDLAPGQAVSVQLAAQCGPMLAVVTLADGTDMRATLDTCVSQVLRVTD